MYQNCFEEILVNLMVLPEFRFRGFFVRFCVSERVRLLTVFSLCGFAMFNTTCNTVKPLILKVFSEKNYKKDILVLLSLFFSA